jgi:hypothetical protein
LPNKNKLDLLFKKYGSDKGGGVKSSNLGWHPHNYSHQGLLYDLYLKINNEVERFYYWSMVPISKINL